MGSVAQAVLEFDEAVQAPWRPPLGGAAPHPGRRRLHAVEPAGEPGVGSGPRSRTGGPRPRRRTAAPCYRGAAASPAAVHSGGGARNEERRPVRRPAAVPAGVSRPPLRLTSRARRLVAVLVLGAGIATGSWVGALVAGDDGGLRLAGETSVVVRAGDTLWSIASSVAGEADVREVVDRIQLINDLQGSVLQPGQVLRLP